MQGTRRVVARLGRVQPKRMYCMDEKRLQTSVRRKECFMQGACIVVVRLGRVCIGYKGNQIKIKAKI
jgi:hypothetical protein